jgi:hypothetical protein
MAFKKPAMWRPGPMLIFSEILDVPVFDGLGENLTELPDGWRFMLDSTIRK